MLETFCGADLRKFGIVYSWIGIIFGVLEIIAAATPKCPETDPGIVMSHTFGGLMQVLLCTLNIIGIKKNSSGYLLPWLILNGISVFGLFLLSLRYLPLILFFAIAAYLYYAMLSLYKKIKSEQASTNPA